MTSINTFYPSMALTHSRNSRGELGMFVNPQSCSCTTCHEYLVDENQIPTGTHYVPSSLPSLPPPRSLQDEDAADSLLMLSTRFESPPCLPCSPSPILRSITGFHFMPSEREDTVTLPASPPSVPEEIVLEPAQARIMYDALTDYIQILRMKQNTVYDTPCLRHDEMAAQDMEFEELDRKIAEMDEMLNILQ